MLVHERVCLQFLCNPFIFYPAGSQIILSEGVTFLRSYKIIRAYDACGGVWRWREGGVGVAY